MSQGAIHVRWGTGCVCPSSLKKEQGSEVSLCGYSEAKVRSSLSAVASDPGSVPRPRELSLEPASRLPNVHGE